MYGVKAFGLMFALPVALGLSLGYFSAKYMTSKDRSNDEIPKECVTQTCPIIDQEKINPFKSNDGDKVIWH